MYSILLPLVAFVMVMVEMCDDGSDRLQGIISLVTGLPAPPPA